MAMPGFSAEASLATTSKGRWIGAAMGQKTTGQGIVPQKIDCDMYIVCVDGIRYLVTDCPDGSGDETRIGVCPRPIWDYIALWRWGSWFTVSG